MRRRTLTEITSQFVARTADTLAGVTCDVHWVTRHLRVWATLRRWWASLPSRHKGQPSAARFLVRHVGSRRFEFPRNLTRPSRSVLPLLGVGFKSFWTTLDHRTTGPIGSVPCHPRSDGRRQMPVVQAEADPGGSPSSWMWTPWIPQPAHVCLLSGSKCKANTWQSRARNRDHSLAASRSAQSLYFIVTWRNNISLPFLDPTGSQVTLDGSTRHHRFWSSGSYWSTDGCARALHPLSDGATVESHWSFGKWRVIDFDLKLLEVAVLEFHFPSWFRFNDSLTDIPSTPRVSTDNIHVHPDYKIYRRSTSKSSLKTVLSSVSSKLRSGSEHFWGSLFSLSHDDSGASSSSSRHSKVIHYLASRYAHLLRQRHNFNNPTAAAQSAVIGARIASVSDSTDYVIPKYCSPTTPVNYDPSIQWLMNESNCFFVYFMLTELLFDIALGSVVFKVYGISDFQNDVVRHAGIDKRCGHADDDVRLGWFRERSRRWWRFRRNGRIFLRTCFRSCGTIAGRSRWLVLSGQRYLQRQRGDGECDRVDDSQDQTTSASNCG